MAQKMWMIDVVRRAREAPLMDAQAADTVLLVRPAAFGFNAEAAKTNVFSHASSDRDLQLKALGEFEALGNALVKAGVEVIVMEDRAEPATPDAVFPNNWVSFHADGAMVLYPMATAPRRLERRAQDVSALIERAGFEVRRIVDLTSHEDQGRFLEGTGSLVLDRPRHRAFANLSSRTDETAIADFDRQLGFETVIFDARDPAGRPIYHTNVLLSLGTRFAVLCLEAVAERDRDRVVAAIEERGRTIVELSFAQLRRFGCNLLELRSRNGDPVIAMSQKALSNLQPDQLRALESFGDLAAADIPTIEAVGGGSVRCMIAEVHLPRR